MALIKIDKIIIVSQKKLNVQHLTFIITFFVDYFDKIKWY